MQENAHLAYDTQVLLGALAGMLPKHVPLASVDVEALRRRLGSGKATVAGLSSALASKEVPYPLTGWNDPLVTVFLLGVEGTVTPTPYSSEVMVPRIIEHMGAFIEKYYPGNGELTPYLKPASAKSAELKKAIEEDKAQNYTIPETTAKVRQLLHAHMKQATETRSAMPYVKMLQADVWSDFMEATVPPAKTPVFSDCADFLKVRGALSAQAQSQVFLYSNGSVKAQRTLLSHAKDGDLTPFVAGFVDTSMVGSKVMPLSYSKLRSHISSVTGLAKESFRIVFCTDSPSEASAADTSGDVDASILVLRPGNAWVNIDTFLAVSAPYITSFAQLTDSVSPVDYEGLVEEVKDLLRLVPTEPALGEER